MKIKIATIAVMLFCVNAISQSNFKMYSKNLTVSESSSKELTDELGNSLNIKNVYKIRLVTRGTNTDTGAEYLAWSNNSIWNIRAVNMKGNISNHPILVLDNNIIKVKTNHANNYGVRIFVEELVSEENDAVPNIFGSSYQWQRHIDNLFYTDGNVGIGTSNPKYKFHLNGDFYANMGEGFKIFGNANYFKQNHDGIIFQMEDGNARNGVTDGGFVFRGYSRQDSKHKDWMVIKTGGKVGIGTLNPTAELSVNGKIHTKEVRVDLNLTDWADFVFTKDYHLPSLKEVENHIKEKGHLKDIPSAKEVEKNGIYLGEMDAKLLQKIEELTLYTIEQEKKIDSLEKQHSKIDKQQKEIQNQRTKIERLESLVKKLLKNKS